MISDDHGSQAGRVSQMNEPEPAVRPPPRRRRRAAELMRVLQERVLGRLDRRRIIFRWDPRAVTTAPSDRDILRIEQLTALPATIANFADPAGQPLAWYRHFFDQRATLWTMVEDARALGSLWMIGARRLGAWYLPLEPDAQIIYGVVTPKWARGRGVAAQLALAAARASEGAPVYLDCLAWNLAAHRAFAKAGFVPVATVGSRWREVRAGPDA